MNTNTPTTPSASALKPLLGAAACVLLAILLLRPAAPDEQPPAARAAAPATTHPDPGSTPASPTATSRPERASATPSSSAAEVPVAGDGPAGDHAVQRLMDSSSPADLPRAQEKHLVALASRIWKAEVTGAGRQEWPSYFSDRQLRAAYRDVRIQAGIARTAPHHRVSVRLVWAGTDPAGQNEDGRTAQVLFTRHNNAWQPLR
ncbi:hypothetical protein ACFRNJ_41910 [Streptomyces sp. NPDC056721]|uniref:hypothetical protein n=1 Tax=Streptomyces sp. NPDC056721 TaxID=3345923 RepID=UPI003677CA34